MTTLLHPRVMELRRIARAHQLAQRQIPAARREPRWVQRMRSQGLPVKDYTDQVRER